MWNKSTKSPAPSSHTVSSSDGDREVYSSSPAVPSSPSGRSEQKLRPAISIATFAKFPNTLGVPPLNHSGRTLSSTRSISPSPSPSPSPWSTPSKKRNPSTTYFPSIPKSHIFASESTARRFSTTDVSTTPARQLAVQLQNTRNADSKLFKNHPGPYYFPEVFPLSSMNLGVHIGSCRPGPRSVSDWLFTVARNIVPESWEKDPRSSIYFDAPFPPPNDFPESTRDHFGNLMNRNHGFEGGRAIQHMTRRLIFGELRVTKISVLRSAPLAPSPEKNVKKGSPAPQKEDPGYYLLVHISHCPGAGSTSSPDATPPRMQPAASEPPNQEYDRLRDEKIHGNTSGLPPPKLHWKTPELFKVMQVRRCPTTRLEQEGYKVDHWMKHGDRTVPWTNFVCPEYVTTATVDQLQSPVGTVRDSKRTKEKSWWSSWREPKRSAAEENAQGKPTGAQSKDKGEPSMKVGVEDTGVYEVEFSEYPSLAQFICVSCYLQERINQVDYRMDAQGVWFADTVVAVMEKLGRVIRVRKGEWSVLRDMRLSVAKVMSSSNAAGGLRLPGRDDEVGVSNLVVDLPTIVNSFKTLVNTFLEKQIVHSNHIVDL